MEAPKSYTIRTETGELRLMSQEEVGALVRSTMEKAKTIPPSPKSPASATSPRPHNPYTSTSQRLSRTPKRGARKFHFRLSPEAKKSNDQKQSAFTSESTSNSSKEVDAECRSEKPSDRSQTEPQRCPSTDDVLEVQEEKPVMEDAGSEEQQPNGGEKTAKKNLSEVDIGDLVRNSIRRARENAKETTPQQLAKAQKRTFEINEITTSPVAKQDEMSWSSNEEQEQESMVDDKVPFADADACKNEEEAKGHDSRIVDEEIRERPTPLGISIPAVNSIVEVEETSEAQMPTSPPNQPSVVSEAQSQISRAFRSFFHGPFQSSQQDTQNELLFTNISVGTKTKMESKEETAQEYLRVDIPSYSEDIRDDPHSLNRIVQETMRRARETAEESVCGVFVDPCERQQGVDPLAHATEEDFQYRDPSNSEKKAETILAKDEGVITIPDKDVTPRRSDDDEVSQDVEQEDESNETRLTEALDISDVDSEIEDPSYQRSTRRSYGPFGGCCGVASVLSSGEKPRLEDADEVISFDAITNADHSDGRSKSNRIQLSTADGNNIVMDSIDPPEGDDLPRQKGPTLEEVVINLMKTETTLDADTAGQTHSFTESAPPHEIEDPSLSKKVLKPTSGGRPLLKLKVSCSSDDEYPTASEVRKSLSASLHSTSMSRTRSASDFSGNRRRAQTLSTRSRRYRRSLRKEREQSPKAQITDEFLADLTKRKGTKITIDELKRMLNVPEGDTDEEAKSKKLVERPTEDEDFSNFTPLQLQPRVPDTRAISTPFCMDIWDLFQPIDDLRRLSDDDLGPLRDSQSAADLESAAEEDTTSVETTTICETDGDVRPNPRMTFSFSARECSSSSDDSTIIGW